MVGLFYISYFLQRPAPHKMDPKVMFVLGLGLDGLGLVVKSLDLARPCAVAWHY